MATYSCRIGGCELATHIEHKYTAATVSPQLNPMEINAGWSLFPVAVLPGQSTFELSITSGKFDADIFSMANAVEYKDLNGQNDVPLYVMPTVERHTIASNKITLLETPVADSVSIRGMTEVDTAPTDTGTFQVDGKDIKFASGEAGTIEVIYDYQRQAYEALIDNQSSAIGEAACIWPVYGSGDDCSESTIIGYYVVKVFRARFTTMPGMDSSYKTAKQSGPLHSNVYRSSLNTGKILVA